MVGTWNFYGFDGQKLKQSYQIEFRAGSKVGDDLYHFFSAEGGWVLACQIDLDGEDDCNLVNDGFLSGMGTNSDSQALCKHVSGRIGCDACPVPEG